MKEEYLDIVDENNKPTGERRLRSEVHSQGLWHRTVHIYLFRQKGKDIEFLIHLRSDKKDMNPGQWDTRFGGHVKAGEDLAQAVDNELADEIGLYINPNNLIEGETYKYDNRTTNREFPKTYYYRFDGDVDNLVFKDSEVQKVKWMSAGEIEGSLKSNPESWTSKPEYFRRIKEVLLAKISMAK